MNNSYRFLPCRLLVASISLAAIAGATSVSAAEAGRVLFSRGDVRIIAPDGSSRAAKRGDIVQDGERMQTGQGALGQVRMVDGERVGVRGDSRVRFSPAPANAAQPRQLELESGRVRVLNVAGPGKPEMNPVEIKTPDGELLMNGADVVVGFVRDSGAAGKAGDAASAAADKTAPAARKVQAQINRGKVQASRGAQKLAMVAGQAAEFSPGKIERVANRLLDLEPPTQRGTQLRPSDTAEDQKLGRSSTPKGPIVKPGSFASSPRAVAGASFPGSVSGTPTLQPVIPSTITSRPPIVQASQLPIVLGNEAPTFTLTRTSDAEKVTVDTLLSRAGALTTGNSLQTTALKVGSKPQGPTLGSLGSLGTVTAETRLSIPAASTSLRGTSTTVTSSGTAIRLPVLIDVKPTTQPSRTTLTPIRTTTVKCTTGLLGGTICTK